MRNRAFSPVELLVCVLALIVLGAFGYAGWFAWENSHLTWGVVIDKTFTPAHTVRHAGHTSRDSQGHSTHHPGWTEHVPDRWTIMMRGPHPDKPQKMLKRTVAVTGVSYDQIRIGDAWAVGDPSSKPLTAEWEP